MSCVRDHWNRRDIFISGLYTTLLTLLQSAQKEITPIRNVNLYSLCPHMFIIVHNMNHIIWSERAWSTYVRHLVYLHAEHCFRSWTWKIIYCTNLTRLKNKWPSQKSRTGKRFFKIKILLRFLGRYFEKEKHLILPGKSPDSLIHFCKLAIPLFVYFAWKQIDIISPPSPIMLPPSMLPPSS